VKKKNPMKLNSLPLKSQQTKPELQTARMHAKLTPYTRQKQNQSPIESNSIESHRTKPSVFRHLCIPSRQEPICELKQGSQIRLIKST